MKRGLRILALAAALGVGAVGRAGAQALRTPLNASGTAYVQWTGLNQVWVRANQSNPGTAVNGTPKDWTADIGLRRTRVQIFGQVTPRVFFYSQIGMNNVNALSPGNGGNRKNQLFVHDAVIERRFSGQDQLKVGAGLSILNGFSRFSQPASRAFRRSTCRYLLRPRSTKPTSSRASSASTPGARWLSSTTGLRLRRHLHTPLRDPVPA